MSRHLLLVGGGHAHVEVLRAFADKPEPGTRLTLVSRTRLTPYSGMLPGCLARLYAEHEMMIDLAALARRAGATFHDIAATGFADGAPARVTLADGRVIEADIVSFDIGITPAIDAIPGAPDHAVPVKPIDGLIPRIAAMDAAPPATLAIVGGGPAGVELAFALHRRWPEAAVTLVTAGDLVPGLNASMRRRVARALARAGIAAVTQAPVARVEAGSVVLADGRSVPAQAVLVATGARAPAWLAGTGLATTPDGFLAIGPDLRVSGSANVFAVGDCATSLSNPRPKAGVFAVRQGPVLARNLRAALRGETLEAFTPQRNYLVLLSTADGSAIGGRGSWLAGEGRLLWWLKDRIDRNFMARYRD